MFRNSSDMNMLKPSLIVFDLDLTLWPFRVDKNVRSPFRQTNRKIVDASGVVVDVFPGVKEILEKLFERNITLAVASRIEDVAGAYQLIHLFDIAKYFTYTEIYPTSKSKHFKQLRLKTNTEFNKMLFLDDDIRNIKAVSRLGVVCFQIPESGFCADVMQQALQHYSETSAESEEQ
ncbi:magnesium-dependent phosphatase 1-like [Schistocerca piceifrons]|uniref:magnesium-dependent phosphatase 1-like n=1 Tax=Schistocerca piceifrons TaxID=274613 RepID=UPI001F5E59FD|nr:magnesium-dependent phosphatase 1-like [Schistocerca piceifrons]